MKKRLISLILCGVMAFGLVSCGDSKEKETSGNSNKTTTSSSSSSNSDKEESDAKKGSSTASNKDEYKSMTTEEAIKFNETKVYEMQEWLSGEGYACELEEYEDKIDGPAGSGYVADSGELPYYKSIIYGAEVKEKKVTVRYEFHYYVDEDALKEGTEEMPKARDLLISEPYKIMTGDEITEETLNKIDEEIDTAYKSGDTDGYDYKLIETNGPFKVNLRFNGPDLTFQIISSGYGDGRSAE